MTTASLHEGPNGTGYVLTEGTGTLAHYPHARAAGGLLWVSGLSARRPDQTIPGVVRGPQGVTRDFAAQADGVFENLERILAAAGADLTHVVDVFAMLVDLADYPAFNTAWNRRFPAVSAPTRTTCVVRSLPLADLLIELKVVAVDPRVRR
ncbi:MAG: RidA family protein [Candidatus Sericytochromatia bacterium]|nr:RidA family protein [Candidatus Sericytochromatia bacterium]